MSRVGPNTPPTELPATLTPVEVAAYLRLGRNQVYESIRRGEIPALKIGARLLVPRRALLRLLDETEQAGVDQHDVPRVREMAG